MKNLTGQVGVYRRPNSNRLKLVKNPLIPIGTMIGRWVVLENDLYKAFANQTHRACRVRCSCADRTEAVRTYGELRCGRSPSCGCKSKERSIEAVWRQLLNAISRRGWECHLTIPQLKELSQLNCVYCGKEPSNIFRLRYNDGDGNGYKRGLDPSMAIRWSGIDRVDSTKGYILGNMVPCCGECNGMKSNLTLDEFYALIERIREHGSTAARIHEQAATIF